MLSIGYMVEQEELHKACYDLLCSEARIGAFVAIAKGDATQQSWFKLGRTHTVAYGRPALISWTGTMFEYLMPALWMRSYPDTLVTRTLTTWSLSSAHMRGSTGIFRGASPSAATRRRTTRATITTWLSACRAIALKWDATAGPVISPYSTSSR